MSRDKDLLKKVQDICDQLMAGDLGNEIEEVWGKDDAQDAFGAGLDLFQLVIKHR